MKKKFIILLIAGAVGAGAGALLGYGPMLRYKSEGVLNMDLSTSEYKRFAELANDNSSFSQYAIQFPPSKLQKVEMESLGKLVAKGEWHKAVAKINKLDTKELTEAALKLESEVEKERLLEKEKAFEKGGVKIHRDGAVYLGLRITYIANEAKEAAEMANWLGAYFKEVATREAVRDQVARWAAENRQFKDRAQEIKLKYDFEISQAKQRTIALKKVIATYPLSVTTESRQVVDVRKDNEKFMSPMAQLVGTESEIIEISERSRKLDREIEQQLFTEAFIKKTETLLGQSRSGSESVGKLVMVITDFTKEVKTSAEREKLLSLAADLSQITARFLSQAQFIAQPSVPTKPEKPTPLMYIIFLSLFFVCLAALYCWHDVIINYFKNEKNDANFSNI